MEGSSSIFSRAADPSCEMYLPGNQELGSEALLGGGGGGFGRSFASVCSDSDIQIPNIYIKLSICIFQSDFHLSRELLIINPLLHHDDSCAEE
jgi:hypothetical protein